MRRKGVARVVEVPPGEGCQKVGWLRIRFGEFAALIWGLSCFMRIRSRGFNRGEA